MKRTVVILVLIFLSFFSRPLLAQDEQKEVMQVVQQFFRTMEQNDSVAYRHMFLPDACTYYIQQDQGSVRTGGRPALDFKFSKDRIIKERFRDKTVEIQVSRNIAMVAGAYDLWVNDKFSHCGTDVFTLLKTQDGWKISSLSYSINKDGCE